MPVPAANVHRVPSRSTELSPHATPPIVRMIEGTGLGVQTQAASSFPPTKNTFCFCSCVPPLDGGRADGPAKV